MAELAHFETHFVNIGDVIKIGMIEGRLESVEMKANTPSFMQNDRYGVIETRVVQVELGDIVLTLKRIPNG